MSHSHQHTGKGRDRIRTSDILIYAGLIAAIIYYSSWEHAVFNLAPEVMAIIIITMLTMDSSWVLPTLAAPLACI